jgi:carboxyl-terminal processing protease
MAKLAMLPTRGLRRTVSTLPIFAMALLCLVAPAFGQVVSGVSHVAGAPDPGQVQSLIEEGKQLEIAGRWADALTHYQHALKSCPENPQIKTRRSIARIHYDLNRRYADSRYVESLARMGGSNALNLYAEILLKIQSYYVDEPDWDSIMRHGLACMEIALSDEQYITNNLPAVERSRLQPAIDQMNSVLGKYPVMTRQDAYVIASNTCRLMQRELGLPLQTSVYEFTCGAIISLDPYSAFMTGNQYGETMSQIEGNFVGLGVELRTHPDSLEIVSVIPHGPAGSGGIVAGDRIVEVDGKPVLELGSEVAADALRGPEGSIVSLALLRDAGRKESIRLQRRRVDIPSVEEARIIDGESRVGYIRLTTFQKTTEREFDAALWSLQQQGMKALIVDVRGNPGGLLNAAVELSDRFISQGVIVSTRGRNPLEDYVHRANDAGTWTVPLVVLIDENSASASEIFAAAIADHQRGVIVGHPSYGKGSVQGIFPLNVGDGGVRLTTARFYSPNGTAISQRGVIPSVNVQSVSRVSGSDASKSDEDEILRVGIEIAKRSANRTVSSR